MVPNNNSNNNNNSSTRHEVLGLEGTTGWNADGVGRKPTAAPAKVVDGAWSMALVTATAAKPTPTAAPPQPEGR